MYDLALEINPNFFDAYNKIGYEFIFRAPFR